MMRRNTFARLLVASGLLLVLAATAAPSTTTANSSTSPQAQATGNTALCQLIAPSPGWQTVLRGVAATPMLMNMVPDGTIWAVGYTEQYQLRPSFGGTMGLILHYDVRTGKWAQDALPAEVPMNTILTAVSVRSANDVWAVGYTVNEARESPVVLHYADGFWKALPSPLIYGPDGLATPPVGMRLTGVTTLAQNTPVVIGYTEMGGRIRPAIVTYGGDGWQWVVLSQLADGTQLAAISGAGPAEIWVVGSYWATARDALNPTSVVMSNAGKGWVVRNEIPGELVGVVATDSAVFAVGHVHDSVGASTLAMAYDKGVGKWLHVKSANPDTDHNFLTSITTWRGDVYAVGYAGIPNNDTELRPLVLRYNGFAFDTVATPHPGLMDGLYSVVGQYDLWAVGSSFQPGKIDTVRSLVLTTRCAPNQ